MLRWNKVIEASCTWSCEIRSNNIEECNTFHQTTEWKFKKFEFGRCGDKSFGDDNLILEILQRQGSRCYELFLTKCRWTLKYFVEILKCVPNLKKLWLRETNVTFEAGVEFPKLSHLKTLKLKWSSCDGILTTLVEHNLTNIQLDDSFHDGQMDDAVNVKNFLKCQKDLKKLSLDLRCTNLCQVLIEVCRFS